MDNIRDIQEKPTLLLMFNTMYLKNEGFANPYPYELFILKSLKEQSVELFVQGVRNSMSRLCYLKTKSNRKKQKEVIEEDYISNIKINLNRY